MYAFQRHLRRRSSAAFVLLLLLAGTSLYLVDRAGRTADGAFSGLALLKQQRAHNPPPAESGAAEEAAGWEFDSVNIALQLPEEVKQERRTMSQKQLFRQYGFNLQLSDSLPLNRSLQDIRLPACKARRYPHGMPKVQSHSVVCMLASPPTAMGNECFDPRLPPSPSPVCS